MSSVDAARQTSAWPHRWAWLLCLTTFPLLWVGGLITTTDAGMAVPDWPATYGRNMFAYPWETWVFGPWDLFIEHGHRLLASFVGLLAIGFLIIVWRNDDRSWMQWLAVAALLLVITQGMLGGLRVIANERLIAMAHGCVGPAFFALTCALVVLTGRKADRSARDPAAEAAAKTEGAGRLAAWTAVLVYGQLILGASLRHIDASVGPWTFAALVKFHLGLAALVVVHTLWVGHKAFWASGGGRWLPLLAGLLPVVVLAQVTLGGGAWLVKYGGPAWATDWLPATIGPNVAVGWTQTNTVTAHSAIGSLLLGLMVATSVLALRLSRGPSPRPQTNLAPGQQ